MFFLYKGIFLFNVANKKWRMKMCIGLLTGTKSHSGTVLVSQYDLGELSIVTVVSWWQLLKHFYYYYYYYCYY